MLTGLSVRLRRLISASGLCAIVTDSRCDVSPRPRRDRPGRIIAVVNPRFFAPEAQVSGDLITLPEEEAEHLTRVLRLGAGAAVRVFNGSGDEFDSVVEAAAKDVVRVRLGSPRDPSPEAHLQVTLAQAVLKGDKMDDVVRDAVMIGATAIRPVLTARTETSVAILQKSHRQHRWERVAISAAKQCGRAVVPPILEPLTFDELMRILQDRRLSGPAFMLVEPGATKSALPFSDLGRRAAEGGHGGRRSGRRLDGRRSRRGRSDMPARHDGEPNAPRRRHGSRRHRGDVREVEGVLEEATTGSRVDKEGPEHCRPHLVAER